MTGFEYGFVCVVTGTSQPVGKAIVQELATHGAVGFNHYADWMRANHPEAMGGYFQVLDRDLEVNGAGGGASDAPQVKHNPIERDWYHTDWVADRTIAWLDGLADDADWFCWMSFPDPHHPWDIPASERDRIDWRTLDLPAGHPGSKHRIREIEHFFAIYKSLSEGFETRGQAGLITLKGEKKALDDEAKIGAVLGGKTDNAELQVKDLGPQISWQTVFMIEYVRLVGLCALTAL